MPQLMAGRVLQASAAAGLASPGRRLPGDRRIDRLVQRHPAAYETTGKENLGHVA
jgi:hypothetical protein